VPVASSTSGQTAMRYVGSGITTSEQRTYVLKGVPDEWRLYAIEL
jgi:hypothetical protein